MRVRLSQEPTYTGGTVMKFTFQTIVLLVITIYVSSFISSLIITAVFLELSFTTFSIVAIISSIGAAIVGIPVTILIQKLAPADNRLIQLLLHAIIGAALVLLYYLSTGSSWADLRADYEFLLLGCSVIINACTFYVTFLLLNWLITRLQKA